MDKELIKQFGGEAIQGLAKNANVRWFVDANVLIRGIVSDLFDDPSNVYVHENVCREVRKRPEAKRGNNFVNEVEKIGNLVKTDWFTDEISESVRFLNKCAMELAPSIRANVQYFIDKEGLDTDAAETRAIEDAALKGWFFKCSMKESAVDAGLISAEDAKIDKRTRKSWFEYPRKRRKKIAAGDYQYTDEQLIATAIEYSVLMKEKVCVLSVDKDLAAIMKQTADNWLWSASAMDCELSRGELVFEEVVALWEYRCQDLDRYRQSCHAKTAMRILEDGIEDPAVLYEPIENEVILCRPDDGHLGNFAFSQKMVDYATDFDVLLSRCKLIRNGFWIPRFT